MRIEDGPVIPPEPAIHASSRRTSGQQSGRICEQRYSLRSVCAWSICTTRIARYGRQQRGAEQCRHGRPYERAAVVYAGQDAGERVTRDMVDQAIDRMNR